MKQRIVWIHCLFLILASLAQGQTNALNIKSETILGPQTPADASNWLSEMRGWRARKRSQMQYDGSEYDRPELKWTQSSFIQPQMMVEDRYFYDPVAGRYTVDRYLDDLRKRYGGIDAVLIWSVYPNIGIDNRNQLDMVRSLPGGISGRATDGGGFSSARREGVISGDAVGHRAPETKVNRLWTAIAKEMKAVGADGVNGDTMSGVPKEYRKASDQTGHILAFEPELWMDSITDLRWDNLSWGYWWGYEFVPSVSKYKWIEPRHMVNVCNRWERNHTDDLQHAFFNGVGFESWENIWGIWNGITPRDAAAIRRLANIERSLAPLLVSRDWEPHVPTIQQGIFATRFPGQGRTLWTVVNRMQYDIAGPQLRIPHDSKVRYFDLWHGVEIKPALTTNGAAVSGELSFEVEAHGYGAVLATEDSADPTLHKLLGTMKALSKKRLADFSSRWTFLPQRQVEIKSTKRAKSTPPGMVRIAGGSFEFVVSGIEIEGGDAVGVDVQYPWEDSPRRYHRRRMAIKPFYMDRYPVSNAKFKQFLDATDYHPRDDSHFLKDWKNGTYPEGWGNKPVTWVSLEDARAYAHWAGKRLPHEWEWQYAAQGSDSRLYPWGNEWNAGAIPTTDQSRALRAPTDVDAYPQGASPFGIMDMVGNVWQWTDEYVDEHTRAAILRGGSYYHPQGSHWYFPNSVKLNEHGKLLLMCPSKDRAGTLGFRCVVDAQ